MVWNWTPNFSRAFLCVKSCHLQIGGFTSFQLGCLLLVLLAQLLWLELLVQCWIAMVKAGSLVLGGKLCLSPLMSMLAVSFSWIRKFTSSLVCWVFLIMKQCWILSSDLSASVKLVVLFYSFLLLIYNIDHFTYIKPPLHSWHNSTQLWYTIIFMVFLGFYLIPSEI